MTPHYTFKCRCGKECSLFKDALMDTVNIREDDLRPRLQRLSELIHLPVFFTEIQNKFNQEHMGWLRLRFSPPIVGFDEYDENSEGKEKGNQVLKQEFNSIVEKHLDKLKNDKNPEISIGKYVFLRSYVKFLDEIVGIIAIGPLIKRSSTKKGKIITRLIPWHKDEETKNSGVSPKSVNRLIGDLESQSKHLNEVFWRRIGDSLITYCNNLDLAITKAVDHPETYEEDKDAIKARFKANCQKIVSLVRQCFFMEGVSLFVWDEAQQSYILEAQAGPSTEHVSWQKHDLSRISLVRSAHKSPKRVAIWPTERGEGSGHIHLEAARAFNDEHPNHPLHQAAAIKLESSDPALAAILALYNPVSLRGESVEIENFQKSLETVLEKELPPVGRDRFEHLLFSEVRRLLEAAVRERRTSMFRLFVREAQTIPEVPEKYLEPPAKLFLSYTVELSQACCGAIIFPGLKNKFFNTQKEGYPYWEELLKSPALKQKLSDSGITIFSEKEFNKLPVSNKAEFEVKLKENKIGWMAVIKLKGATGKTIALLGLAWTNALKRDEKQIEQIKANLSGLFLQSGALFEILIESQKSEIRHALWDQTLKTYYQAIADAEIPADWDSMTAFVQTICDSITKLSGRDCAYFLIEDWGNHLYPTNGEEPADAILLRRMAGPDSLPNAVWLLKKKFRAFRNFFKFPKKDQPVDMDQYWVEGSFPGWSDGTISYIGKVLKQYRGILVMKDKKHLPEEDRHLVELLVLLMGRSHLLMRFRSEIHHAQRFRELNFHENQSFEVTNQILEYLSKKNGAWPGFRRAIVMLKVPWRADPICASRYPFQHEKREFPEIKMQLIAQIAGLKDNPPPNHRSVLIQSSASNDETVKQFRMLLPPTTASREGFLLLIPLVSRNESLGWVLAELDQEPPFQVARLAEVLAREWALNLISALKHEEIILAISMMHHGLRRQLEDAEFPIINLEGFARNQGAMVASGEEFKTDISSLKKTFKNMTKRLDNDTILLKLMQAPDQFTKKEIVGMNHATDIAKIIRASVDEMKVSARETRRVRIRLHFSQQMEAKVPGDSEYLRYLIENILHNAVKYSFKWRHVDVKLEKEMPTGKWTLEITNAGKPFPESAEMLLTPFKRVANLDPRRPNIPGSGLGLAVVGMICAAMGAEINIYSEKAWRHTENNSNKKIAKTEWYLNRVLITFPQRRTII